MQQRRKNPPAGIQLVVPDKVRVVALESVQNERLVCLGDLEVGETTAVCQIKFGHDRLHRKTGQFRVHLDIDGLIRLHANDQLIAWDVLKDA